MLCFQLCFISYNIINNEQYEKNMGDKSEIQHSHRETASCYHELIPCIVSEKNWNTKEDKGKSMTCVLYVLQLAKWHIPG